MKKAKLMLTGIAILAVVGGALAFKAKTAFGFKYCYSTTSGTCNLGDANYKIDAATGTQYYYVVTNDVSKCNQSPIPNCSGDQVNNITTSTTFLTRE
jgi:hypothetical protein